MNRIVQLPAGLAPGSDIYLAALVGRGQVTDSLAQLFLCKNYAFNGAAGDSYSLLSRMARFSWQGSLAADFLAAAAKTAVGNALPVLPPEAPASSPFPLVAGCNVQLTGPDLILDDVTDFDALAGAMLVFVDSEIMSISVASLTGSGSYSLTVVRGFFNTAIADHFAGANVFIVRRADVIPFTHPSFQNGNILQFKLTLGVGSVSDADPFGFIVGGSPSSSPAITFFAPTTWDHTDPNAGVSCWGVGFSDSGPLADSEYATLNGVQHKKYSGGTNLQYPGEPAPPASDLTEFTLYGIDVGAMGLSAGAVLNLTYTNANGTTNTIQITLT